MLLWGGGGWRRQNRMQEARPPTPERSDAGPPAGVAIRLVGRLSVVRDGVALADKQVGSRKARTLLAVLAAEPDVSRDAEWLAARLWPEDAPKDPADNVATLVSRLRSALGAAAIGGDRGGWQLGDVDVDVREAARLVDVASQHLTSEPTLALTAATQAVRLLEADVLVGEPDAEWLTELQRRVRRLTRAAQHAGAAAALGVDDPARALVFAEAAVGCGPLRRDGRTSPAPGRRRRWGAGSRAGGVRASPADPRRRAGDRPGSGDEAGVPRPARREAERPDRAAAPPGAAGRAADPRHRRPRD